MIAPHMGRFLRAVFALFAFLFSSDAVSSTFFDSHLNMDAKLKQIMDPDTYETWKLFQHQQKQVDPARSGDPSHLIARTDSELLQSLRCKGFFAETLMKLLRKIHDLRDVEPWLQELLSRPKVPHFSFSLTIFIYPHLLFF